MKRTVIKELIFSVIPSVTTMFAFAFFLTFSMVKTLEILTVLK